MLKSILLKRQKFVLRLLEPTDVEAYVTLFNQLGEETIRCRFGHLIANLTPATAGPFLGDNTPQARAVAVFNEEQDRIAAIGRCYLDPKTKDAEIAIVVAEAMRRLGLGSLLLQELIELATREGSKTVSAYIATKNAPVIKLLQSVGFEIQPVENEDDLKLVLLLPSPSIAIRD